MGCVFKHFGVQVPPAESDAVWHPELMTWRKKLLAQRADLAADGHLASEQSGTPGDRGGKKGLAKQKEFWTHEAIIYLGYDRRELKRPDRDSVIVTSGFEKESG